MSKIHLFFIVLTMFVSVTTVLAYTVYRIDIAMDEDLAIRKEQELSKVAQNLKNYVDILYSAIESYYDKSSKDRTYIEKNYGSLLKNIIAVAETGLKQKSEQVKKGELTLAEAQSLAIKEIKEIRYRGQKGHIWITDTTLPYPKMIMHPIIPLLEGQVMNDPKYNTVENNKQNLFAAAVEATQKNGDGFVYYLVPKPTKENLTLNIPKLSYVKLFSQWNWILGTDFYIDVVIRDTMNEIKEAIRTMRYGGKTGYFWIIDITDESSPKYAMHPFDHLRENKVLEGELTKYRARVETFIKVCKKEGSGYVEYNGEKPTDKGFVMGTPKLTYVKLFKPLGWVIGTGAYLDGIEKSFSTEKALVDQHIRSLILHILSGAIFIIFGMAIFSYTFNHYFGWRWSSFRLLRKSIQKTKEVKNST